MHDLRDGLRHHFLWRIWWQPQKVKFLIRNAGVTVTVRFGDLWCELCKHWPASKHFLSLTRELSKSQDSHAKNTCRRTLLHHAQRLRFVEGCQVLKDQRSVVSKCVAPVLRSRCFASGLFGSLLVRSNPGRLQEGATASGVARRLPKFPLHRF